MSESRPRPAGAGEKPVTHCPECTQPAPADARFCPHCRHSFALYVAPATLPQPERKSGLVGLLRRVRGG